MMMMRLLLSSQNFPEGLTGKPKAEAALTSRFHWGNICTSFTKGMTTFGWTIIISRENHKVKIAFLHLFEMPKSDNDWIFWLEIAIFLGSSQRIFGVGNCHEWKMSSFLQHTWWCWPCVWRALIRFFNHRNSLSTVMNWPSTERTVGGHILSSPQSFSYKFIGITTETAANNIWWWRCWIFDNLCYHFSGGQQPH